MFFHTAFEWQALTRENLSSGFSTKLDSNQPAQLQRIEILLEASPDMLLSNKWITKVLIKLRGCTGWSAPLLFTNSTTVVCFLRRVHFN